MSAESEGRSGILDTLPEERPSKIEDAMSYKRVYPDWKPTVDKTDVVGAMEAIEGNFEPLNCIGCHNICSLSTIFYGILNGQKYVEFLHGVLSLLLKEFKISSKILKIDSI